MRTGGREQMRMHGVQGRNNAWLRAGLPLLLLCLLGPSVPGAFAQAENNAGTFPPGEYVSATYLPERVREAARRAKPGLFLQKARLSWPSDEGVYVIIGSYYGQSWRLKVTSTGEVLSVKRDS